MEPNPNTPPKSPDQNTPLGFENWSLEKKEEFLKEKSEWQVPDRIAPPPVIEKEKTFEEEWGEFENLRNDLAKTEALKGNFSGDTGMSIEDLRLKYENQRKNLAKKLGGFYEGNEAPQTQEEKENLNSRINDILFEKFVKEENDAYLNALREARGAGKFDKAKEAVRNLLGTKAVKWYLGLSKRERMACSFAIGTVAGLTLGAGAGAFGTMGYIGKKALSGVAGVGVGEWVNTNKKWSLEEINKLEEAEKEELKNSSHSLEEKSKIDLEIRKKYKKERLKAAAWKAGLTVVAGAGTGFLANLAEGAFTGTSGVTKSVLETKNQNTGGVDDNRWFKGRFGQSVSKETGVLKEGLPVVPKAPTPEPAMPEPVAPKPEVAPEAEVTKTEVTEPTEASEPTEPPLLTPEVLVHEVKSGDSVWKLLDKTLENNEQFKGMTEAQKTYVLSNLTNKMLVNPETYGFRSGGAVEIGDKLNFTEAFKDNKEVESLFEKAKQTIEEGSNQEKLILKNNEKIASWVENNKGKPLNEETVSEILNTKPKVVAAPAEVAPDPLPNIKKEESLVPKTDLQKEVNVEIADEIAKARKGFPVPESSPRPTGLRTMSGDVAAFNNNVDSAFREEIDGIYGKGGVFGIIGKVAGVDTKEWGEIKSLSAGKVLEYFRNPRLPTDLPSQAIKNLQTSEQHRKLIEQVSGLIGEANQKTGIELKPFENENMESFIKRLGAFLMKQPNK